MVIYTHKAQIAFDTMQPHEQLQMKSIEQSLDHPMDDLVCSGLIKKLDMSEEVYALRNEDMVVMVDCAPQGTRILDIVPWQRLVHFHNALHNGKQLETV